MAAGLYMKCYIIMKRMCDLFACIPGLVLLVLLFMPVALAIKLSSPGSVFFSQQRIGLNGNIFYLYKFRTMKMGAEEDGAVWAVPNDPRTFAFGSFLRRSRLDELPQFINILRGEMSLVGPRPERPEFLPKLQKKINGYTKRLEAKPGVTGYAQISCPYASSIHESISKFKYDMYYIDNRSLLFDLKILLRTIKVIVRLEGR